MPKLRHLLRVSRTLLLNRLKIWWSSLHQNLTAMDSGKELLQSTLRHAHGYRWPTFLQQPNRKPLPLYGSDVFGERLGIKSFLICFSLCHRFRIWPARQRKASVGLKDRVFNLTIPKRRKVIQNIPNLNQTLGNLTLFLCALSHTSR